MTEIPTRGQLYAATASQTVARMLDEDVRFGTLTPDEAITAAMTIVCHLIVRHLNVQEQEE